MDRVKTAASPVLFKGATVGVISLGCDKNRIDTENMLAYLEKDGYVITGAPQDADILIVNTCAFIESAKREAIDTVFEMSEYKTNGRCKCLVVTGCLPQRYMDELSGDMDEVDIFLGTANYEKLTELLEKFNGAKIAQPNDKDKRVFTKDRVLTTPYHYAYLKIAEGCDNKCTYCAIPSIRGKYTSRPIEDIVAEARMLIAEYSVKELIIVAQDTTRYGFDIYGEYRIVELLRQLSLENVRWIRLLYCYPEQVTDELLQEIDSNPKIVKYLDIPMQHASTAVLKRMNRRVDKEQLEGLIARIRAKKSNINIRTTFIVGFPGESAEQFDELADFVAKHEFEKCGFFAYSQEDGTAAAKLKEQLSQDIKEQRVEKLYEIQEQIMLDKATQAVGSIMEVVYEDIDYDNSRFIARRATDSPDIDGLVYMTSDRLLEIGELYNVKITHTEGIDLIGVVQ